MELINGRTAEEIKRGLRCQGSKGNIKCSECAYCIGQFGDLDCDYECDQIDGDALALIERLEEAQPRWISVYDALPEVGETLIMSFGRVCIAWHHGLGRFETPSGIVWSAPEIEWWMPLPEPPKEGA